MDTTNNFSAKKPRQLFHGPFAALEPALAHAIADHKQTHGPLAPLHLLVPTRLLGLHLQRTLARTLPTGHANLRFVTFPDLLPATPTASPLALELLCRQLARDPTLFPADGYFHPVADTPGFAAALLTTFTDLQEAGLTNLPATTPKLRELAAAYTAYRRWLTDHNLLTEADRLLQSPTANFQSPIFLYGFYDLNAAQQHFVEHLAPAVIFFPATAHAEFAQPLLDWFQSRGYETAPSSSIIHHSSLSVVSCPGEPAEVREAVRTALDWLRAHPDRTANDIALLCRSRDQYDAILRDTLPQLGLRAFFRGGRPLSEDPDATRLLLLLETIRTDYSRAAVMELACHLGPHSHWDALSVELGIVKGQAQWQARLRADDAKLRPLAQFVADLFRATAAIPASGQWAEFTAPLVAAFRQLGGQHPVVIATIEALAGLDAVHSPIDLETFAEFCRKALTAATTQTEQFQGGNLFVSDVMSARGLSFPLVIVLGLVEKSFPRLIREDPLLLDDERAGISPDLPLKHRGQQEERLLFDLATGTARDQLVLSFPRLDAATARPRLPSFLLLTATGAANFQALEKLPGFRSVPLSAVTCHPLAVDERELDLAALQTLAETGPYLAAIAPALAAGVTAETRRWREPTLTGHDGVIETARALAWLRDRFGLDKLVISATSLENFFRCPFYYFQKHVLRLDEWTEPEAALTIDPADLGALYHAILEDFYRAGGTGDVAAVADHHFRQFEQRGVTGFPTVWAIKQEIVRHELLAFVARDQHRRGADWRPAKCEEEFNGVAVAPPLRLRGKIDRIDLSADGHRARVLDYKTGRLPRGLKDDALAAGEALQLPLYLLAAEQLLPGVTVESARYLYFTLRGGYRDISFSRTALTDRRAELTRLLETAAGMIRDGVFAQFATADGCRDCSFRPICGNGILKLYQVKAGEQRMAAFRAIKETVA